MKKIAWRRRNKMYVNLGYTPRFLGIIYFRRCKNKKKTELGRCGCEKRVLKEGCQFSNSSTPRGSNACATDNERFEGAYHNNHNWELFMGIKKFSEHKNMMHPLEFLPNHS